MRLTDILKPDCVKVPLDATDKSAAIDELIALLSSRGRVSDPASLRQAVWSRETTRTTGIGHGLAIPHGKCLAADRLVMAVGRLATPIEFNAIDGRPVNIIFLLASPPDQTGPHIQALARISRLMTRESFRADVLNAPDAQTLYNLIAEQEKEAVT